MNNMNEILRRFERESGIELYGLGAKRVPWEAALERFADLIVREVINVYNSDGYQTEYEKDMKVLEHFRKPVKTENLGALDQYDDPAWQGKQVISAVGNTGDKGNL